VVGLDAQHVTDNVTCAPLVYTHIRQLCLTWPRARIYVIVERNLAFVANTITHGLKSLTAEGMPVSVLGYTIDRAKGAMKKCAIPGVITTHETKELANVYMQALLLRHGLAIAKPLVCIGIRDGAASVRRFASQMRLFGRHRVASGKFRLEGRPHDDFVLAGLIAVWIGTLALSDAPQTSNV
jgi:hypothetical protein